MPIFYFVNFSKVIFVITQKGRSLLRRESLDRFLSRSSVLSLFFPFLTVFSRCSRLGSAHLSRCSLIPRAALCLKAAGAGARVPRILYLPLLSRFLGSKGVKPTPPVSSMLLSTWESAACHFSLALLSPASRFPSISFLYPEVPTPPKFSCGFCVIFGDWEGSPRKG